MIKWLQRKETERTLEPEVSAGFLSRIQQRLSKTRAQLGDRLAGFLRGKKTIDPAVLEAVETTLLSADFGIETTEQVVNALQNELDRNLLADGDAVFQALTAHLTQLLAERAIPLVPETTDKTPFVILMVGINGAGKTTTIGKLAKQFQDAGKKVMLAAGDTFRAAAVEQLKVWGERHHIPVIAQHTGADAASVIFDALQAAKARGMDILIADTAGRLHTQTHLMNELKKIKRVLQKLDPVAPHEIMLVLDASIGQNALAQAREFHEAMGVTGITMTKLDGTAKGGILFAIGHQLEIPFRYVGFGEAVDDLQPLDANAFVHAIFDHD